MVALVHEVWECPDDNGQWLPTCMLAGPDGDEARSVLSIEARLMTTFEAHSPYEAMTAFHKLVGFAPYMSLDRRDRRSYTEQQLMRQFRGR